jgi:hypothetical protein
VWYGHPPEEEGLQHLDKDLLEGGVRGPPVPKALFGGKLDENVEVKLPDWEFQVQRIRSTASSLSPGRGVPGLAIVGSMLERNPLQWKMLKDLRTGSDVAPRVERAI